MIKSSTQATAEKVCFDHLSSALASNAQTATSQQALRQTALICAETARNQPLQVEVEDQDDSRTKRRRLADENPDVKKRNRNMFGLLTRTLQACQ